MGRQEGNQVRCCSSQEPRGFHKKEWLLVGGEKWSPLGVAAWKLLCVVCAG